MLFEDLRKQNWKFCVVSVSQFGVLPEVSLPLFLDSAFEMPGKGCQGVFLVVVVEICYGSARRH